MLKKDTICVAFYSIPESFNFSENESYKIIDNWLKAPRTKATPTNSALVFFLAFIPGDYCQEAFDLEPKNRYGLRKILSHERRGLSSHKNPSTFNVFFHKHLNCTLQYIHVKICQFTRIALTTLNVSYCYRIFLAV